MYFLGEQQAYNWKIDIVLYWYMFRCCTICKSMYNDSIYRISTDDNLGSVFADKLQKNRLFLLFCFRTYCDSRSAQSSYMCSFFVYYCLSALFCPWSIHSRIKAAECPFGNFNLLKHIPSDRQPVLDTEVYPVVMQASQLIWRSSWWWSHGCWIYNYLCSQYLSQIKLCEKRLSVISNPAHGRRHSIHCLIKFVSDFDSRSWQAALYTLCGHACQWLATFAWYSNSLQ
jgi:hypothetical protein